MEARGEEGCEEGNKDRPCAVVVAFEDSGGRKRVFVLPITHTAPKPTDMGIEIPRVVKTRLGLDWERSWIIISESNVFAWPGPDLRPATGHGAESIAFGMLPPTFFRIVRDAFLKLDAERRVTHVRRTE